jgi:hypothetical protein
MEKGLSAGNLKLKRCPIFNYRDKIHSTLIEFYQELDYGS